jgi:transcriptional regulator of acetoin/glycerol metabolism
VENGLTHAISRPTAVELRALLERHRGNVGSLAREIGRQRTLVWRWLRVAGLKPAEYRNADGDLPNA